MCVVRASAVEEYARWYLQRDRRKHGEIADDSGDPVEVMRRDHSGKMRDWFRNATRWRIVSLDAVNDLANLVFLECECTKREGLVIPDGEDYRLLRRVAENAIAGNFLGRPSATKCKHYYDELAAGSLRLEQKGSTIWSENRLVDFERAKNEYTTVRTHGF